MSELIAKFIQSTGVLAFGLAFLLASIGVPVLVVLPLVIYAWMLL